MLIGVLFLGFGVDRTDFWQVLTAFSAAFAGYGLVLYGRMPLAHALGLGLGLRLALVLAFPLLSDDVYRFLWDGYLINAGRSPYAALPTHWPPMGLAGLDIELLAKLNSPGYYSIYPP
ncbi:MAG: hypothetical protein HC821_02760 [Lewinella sp.]|nr:hypothetical protein [Lewinella sp.]